MNMIKKYFTNKTNQIFCVELPREYQEWPRFVKNEWIEISESDALETANPTLSDEEKLHLWRASAPEITPKQLRLVLLENGITDANMQAAIANIPDETVREVAAIEWNNATGYQRNNPNLIMIATELLGLDALQIDTMWQSALLK